ncbi:hypothetical protein O181_021515 [Austropuccinia psidii MF-1]|uniref:Uncharacterized protein n=1 Tax=Austropuccinia psidii MF-1 TaxID=1389203 RepID=A0A9Q3CFV1_9BASI|nr:hypothetical protein [Austropuccinia psidii MF-1]
MFFDSVEENFIPLETQSQCSTPVITSETEGNKGKERRHSQSLITTKKWTPVSTQRSRKPQNSASIKGKPTLITCTGKITRIDPVVASKSKFPKEVEKKFVQGTVKGALEFRGTSQRAEKACPEPEDLEEDTLDTVVDGKTMREIIPTLQFTFQFNRNMKPEDWKLTRSRSTQLSSGFTPFRHSQIRGQESPFFTIPGSFQEKTRIQREKQDLFQPQAERVRPNDIEAVGLGERSTQEPEVVVNTSRISSPTNRNITPTQNEHNVVTPESNLKIDQLWLQMSQFSVKTQEKFDAIHRSNERLKELTTLHEATIKAIQESCSKLCKASKETNKILNPVFEEQYHCKRDRDCLDQDINKFFNFCQNMKPQPQGYALDNPYKEDIKPDFLLNNKPRAPSTYQDGDNMTYSEKEAPKQLPEASS